MPEQNARSILECKSAESQIEASNAYSGTIIAFVS